MKKFFKWVGIVIGAVIVIGIVSAIAGGGNDMPSTNTQPKTEQVTPQAQPQPQAEQPKAEQPQAQPEQPKNSPKINKAEFDQIQNDMTYDQVVAIIGGEGEVMSESKIADITTTMYTWDGEGDLGANANAMFQNGKLVSKAQFGLK